VGNVSKYTCLAAARRRTGIGRRAGPQDSKSGGGGWQAGRGDDNGRGLYGMAAVADGICNSTYEGLGGCTSMGKKTITYHNIVLTL